jgi:GMP synthase (glutamine-hydrolysing)
MTTILILEAQSPDIVQSGHSYAANFVTTLMAIDQSLTLISKNPYLHAFTAADFDGVHGIVFTGSGVDWNTGDPRGQAQVDAMKAAFQTGKPCWGSCNGFQLMGTVLGGVVGESPNGFEGGLAKNLTLTEAGKTHPMMKGRKDGDAVPCIHRDEIQTLPEGAVLLAGNAHSAVQAAVYEQNGIDYWGAQYHPELTPAFIAASLTRKDADGFAETIAEMNDLTANPTGDYTLELRNWLDHVNAKKTALKPETASA